LAAGVTLSISISPPRVAVIGAGAAGASCARRLADAGHAVQVFDKSRGVGGRLATRRIDWTDAQGGEHRAHLDHGAPAFTARSPEFNRFVEQACGAGWLARWAPVMAPGNHPTLENPALWVAVPDMPALCRQLLGGIPLHLSCQVDAVRRDERGWRVESKGQTVAEGFNHVVLALPPPQTAPLLQPHRADWAQQAQGIPMLPCWTLMGVTEQDIATDCTGVTGWDLALPTRGPLFWITRNESKPGRTAVPGLAHWVVHATAEWSQTHSEAPAGDVQALLQTALADVLKAALGHAVAWRHAGVHRWRYASVPRADATVAGHCWWDPSMGLGVCGDALGGAGVEGAWTSGQALARAVLEGAHGRT